MNLWGWVIAYALVFALLQLVVYYYLRRDANGQSVTVSVSGDGGQSGGTPPTPSAYPEASVEGTTTDPTGDDDRLRCPHCGAPNERDGMYTYCRHCTKRLSA